MKDYSVYKLNVQRSPYDPKAYKARQYLKVIVLPEILDYRDVFDKYFPVIDQGSQGSCAGCSGTAMRQYQEYLDTGLLKKLSEQFVYNNREDTSVDGMYMQDLMRILYKIGICLNDLCEYGSTRKPTEAAYKDALKRLTQGYASVNTIEEFKTALYTQGPCVVAVPVYNYTERMWVQRTGDKFLGGHAMCCCGYNKEGFIIRNSWGTDWGQHGYCILPYSDFNLVWETFTTIDAPTVTEAPGTTQVPDESWWYKNKWWVITLSILTASTILWLIFR